MNADVNATSEGSDGRGAAVKPKGKLGRRLLLVFLFFVGAGGVAFFMLQNKMSEESLAVTRLNELGVVFTNSGSMIAKQIGDGRHPGTAIMAAVKESDLGEAVEQLKNLPFLKAVDFSGTALSDEEMSQLCKITTLAALNVNKTKITDAGMKHVGALKRLESIYLAETDVTQASLPEIAKLSSLRRLDLAKTKVTGGLGCLAALPQFEWLLLNELTIDDDSLAELGKSKSFNHLTMINATLKDEASLTQLVEQLKGLKIERE